ncbi:AclJ [Streptomyces misionensis JCM 4497]
MGARAGRVVREFGRDGGDHAARHRAAGDRADHPGREEREDPQDAADAGGARGRVRGGRLAGRRAEAPGVVLQHQGRSAGRAAGRPGAAGHGGARGHRGGEGPVVGAGGGRVPAVRRLPAQDGPGDPGVRAGAGRDRLTGGRPAARSGENSARQV